MALVLEDLGVTPGEGGMGEVNLSLDAPTDRNLWTKEEASPFH